MHKAQANVLLDSQITTDTIKNKPVSPPPFPKPTISLFTVTYSCASVFMRVLTL